jgi:hypothetical protein
MTTPSVQYATGKEPAIGFATAAIANASRDEENVVETGDVEEVEGEAGAVESVITSNLGKEVSVNGTALSGMTLPEIGDALTAADLDGYCTAASMSSTPTLSRFNLGVKKEDSITVT